MRQFLIIVLTLVTGACVTPNNAGGRMLSIDGLFSVPIVEGTFIPEDCKTGTPGASKYLKEPFACVAYSWGNQPENPPEWRYIELLAEQGWNFSGGAGSVLTLERHVDENCSTELYLIGVIQGDPIEVEKWGRAEEIDMDWGKIDNGLIQIVPNLELVCGEGRFQRTDSE